MAAPMLRSASYALSSFVWPISSLGKTCAKSCSGTSVIRALTSRDGVQNFHTSSRCCQNEEEGSEAEQQGELDAAAAVKAAKKAAMKFEKCDVETSMKYLKSKAYKYTYGDAYVWQPYRRNFKGQRPPEKTRLNCVRSGYLATNNPCPICRDKYLVVHHQNLELLQQFVDPLTGLLRSYKHTGVCQRQFKNLQVELLKAWDAGLIEMPLPHREYDYNEYYSKELLQQNGMKVWKNLT